MITALFLGVGVGVGLWMILLWLVPPRPALGVVLARLANPPAPPPILDTTDERDWLLPLTRPLVGMLGALGMPTGQVRADLAVLGRNAAAHLARQSTAAVAGLAAPSGAAMLLAVLGAPVGITVPAGLAVALGVIGFVTPDLQLRGDAARRRGEFRHALSAYLDLVVIALAGGSGVHSALTDAANTASSWPLTQIRHALDTARMTRTTPWAALRQLGDDLDVPELAELAASVSLAGTEGARVRASLAAKATSLRTHQLTDAEAHAHAATERLALPVTLLFLGFLVFIGYPALDHILNF